MEWEYKTNDHNSESRFYLAGQGAICLERSARGRLQVRKEGEESCYLIMPMELFSSGWSICNQEGKKVGQSLGGGNDSKECFSLLEERYQLRWNNFPQVSISDDAIGYCLLRMGLDEQQPDMGGLEIFLTPELTPEVTLLLLGLAWYRFEPIALERMRSNQRFAGGRLG